MVIYGNNQGSTEINYSEKFPPINILTVDFDWIMEPSIQAYNGIVNAADTIWEARDKLYSKIQYPCDIKKYGDLCIYLGNIVRQLSNQRYFLYADHHDDIIGAFDEWKIGYKRYNLYNIDHHHDCGYPQDDNSTYEEIKNDCGCHNWVLHLMDKHPNCNRYTWINNETSIDLFPDVIMEKHSKILYSSTEIEVIDPIHFDYVFLCKSPAWVPPEYYPLYDGLTQLLENIVIK